MPNQEEEDKETKRRAREERRKHTGSSSRTRSRDKDGESISDRREKDRARKDRKSQETSTPGAFSSTDSSTRSKSGRKSSSSDKARSTSIDKSDRSIVAVIAIPNRMENVAPPSLLVFLAAGLYDEEEGRKEDIPSKSNEGEILLEATAVDEKEEKPEKEVQHQTATVPSSMETQEQATNEESHQQRTLSEEEQADERRRGKRLTGKVCIWLTLAILVIAVAVVFLIGGGNNKTNGGGSNIGQVPPDDNNTASPSNVTASPTETASSISDTPSSAPTELVYDAPSDEDCQRLVNGLPPLDEEESMFIRSFDIPLNIGLANSSTDPATVIPELEEKLRAYMVPQIVGCPPAAEQRRLERMVYGRHFSRQLRNIKYMIADANVRVTDDNEDCIAANSLKCSVVRVGLTVKLRGDERNFRVILLLGEYFVENKDLSDDLKLSTMIDTCIRTTAIQSNNPTTSPTAAPTDEPSVSPTPLPTVTGSSNPSMRPVFDPVSEPSMTPTKVSTPSPTIVPIPETTPSPTGAPTTKNPTKSPTKVPTPDLSAAPTIVPSESPSFVPTVVASSKPSKVPSMQPSAAPSRMPSIGPSSYPSASPSAAPTSKLARLEAILSRFAPFEGNETLALDWLVTDTWEPPSSVTEETSRGLWEERFALVVFYYATGGEGNTWKNKEGWLTSASVCSWNGIEGCNADGSVTQLRRRIQGQDFGLVGDFPDEMRALSNLEFMEFARNRYMSGTIPSFLAELTKLTYLNLVLGKERASRIYILVCSVHVGRSKFVVRKSEIQEKKLPNPERAKIIIFSR